MGMKPQMTGRVFLWLFFRDYTARPVRHALEKDPVFMAAFMKARRAWRQMCIRGPLGLGLAAFLQNLGQMPFLDLAILVDLLTCGCCVWATLPGLFLAWHQDRASRVAIQSTAPLVRAMIMARSEKKVLSGLPVGAPVERMEKRNRL
jgi:hypothetical protein